MKKVLLIPVLVILIFFCRKAEAQSYIDSVSFETPLTQIVINPAGNGLWQIGRPQKTFFDSAHTGAKAILTDTVNSYPPNDTASFIYIIRNPYTQTCFTNMEFWHKYDMNSLDEKGIIDASYDGGSSWVIVSDTSDVLPMGSFFWWDMDYHEVNGDVSYHNLDITGKSDGWIKSKFNWQWFIMVKGDTIIANPDSLMIRFTFISDSVETNKEGWMIDDIVTSSADPESCSRIGENAYAGNISVYPNPFVSQATLRTKTLLYHATLTVYNSYGQAVKQIPGITGQTVTLNRDDLSAGLYFLRLTEDSKTIATEILLITD